MKKFLARLFPQRLQETVPVTHEERRKLLATVADQDPCLRATLDLLQENLLNEFGVLIDPRRSDAEVLRAVQGVRVAYYALNQLEDERAAAKKWREQQEQQR